MHHTRKAKPQIIIIIIIIGTINNKERIAATLYPLGTWFVPGICVWLPA